MSSENINKKCFIITPIGKDLSTTRRATEGLIDAAIIPALLELSFTEDNISVAHRISESGSINRQIITRIVEDDIAIVNLTELNPNVMYELAVRHSVAKPVVIIAEHGTNLPFDIIEQRTVFYINDMLGVVQLKEELKTAVIESLKIDEIDNPIIKIIQENSALKKVSTVDSDVMQLIFERLDRIEIKTTKSFRESNNLEKSIKDTILVTMELVISDPEIDSVSTVHNWINKNIINKIDLAFIRHRVLKKKLGKYRIIFEFPTVDGAKEFINYVSNKSITTSDSIEIESMQIRSF